MGIDCSSAGNSEPKLTQLSGSWQATAISNPVPCHAYQLTPLEPCKALSESSPKMITHQLTTFFSCNISLDVSSDGEHVVNVSDRQKGCGSVTSVTQYSNLYVFLTVRPSHVPRFDYFPSQLNVLCCTLALIEPFCEFLSTSLYVSPPEFPPRLLHSASIFAHYIQKKLSSWFWHDVPFPPLITFCYSPGTDSRAN